jgi:pilus assembly protein FimV
MTEIRKRAFVGIVGLVSAGLFSVGCGSSSNTTGTAGSSGSAGTSGGGGTTGSAGTTGAGGTTVAACAAAPAALITDFGTGTAQVGTAYKGAAASLTAPTFDTSTGALVMTFATGAATATDNYAYVGLPFNACVDAHAYTGVKFNIMGTLSTGCTIQFSTVDKEHSTTTNGGTCAATSCYASSSAFTLPSAATDVTVAFASQTGGGADTGAAVVDPTEILNVQWQINVPTAGCTGTVTVDNVTFN